MRARRALLYVPGQDQNKIDKAATLDVDCVCLDLEDAVPVPFKEKARKQVAESLQHYTSSRPEKIVRINSIGSGFEIDDLETILPAKPDAILVPKIEHRDQIQWVSSKISSFESKNKIKNGTIPILLLIETPMGVLNLNQIVGCDERIKAIAIGAEDLATCLGATRTEAGWEVFHVRSEIILHTAAHGLQAIDMVYPDLKNLEGLRQSALQGVQMGFSGKQVVHPDQIEPVQDAFTPNKETIQHALRIIEEYHRQLSVGRSVFTLDGKMIEPPNITNAENIIARAKVAGILK